MPWIAVFLRVGAAMAVMPAFGEQMVSMRLRLALTVAFSVVVTPLVGAEIEQTAQGPSIVLFMAMEVIAGLILGLGLRFLIMALQIAGTIAAQSTSLAQLFGGASADPQPAISQVLVLAGLALATMAGLHIKVAQLLYWSYEIMAAGQLRPAADLASWGIVEIGSAFSLAFALAAPFVITSVLYNAALGVINRAMPQLMVAFVGAPAITAGALLLLALSAPYLLSVWFVAFEDQLARPLDIN